MAGLAYVQGTAKINVAATVSISSADFSAISKVYAWASTEPILQKWVGLAVAIARTDAEVEFAGSVNASGNVTIQALTDQTVNAFSDAAGQMDEKTGNVSGAAAAAVSVIDSKAVAHVAVGATLAVGGDLLVQGDTVNRTRNLSRAVSTKDGPVAISVALDVEQCVTSALLDGSATVGGSVTVNADQRREDVPVSKLFVLPSFGDGVSAVSMVDLNATGDLLDDTKAGAIGTVVGVVGQYVSLFKTGMMPKVTESNSPSFTFGAAVALAIQDNSTLAEIGDGTSSSRAVVTAKGPILVTATTSNRPHANAVSAAGDTAAQPKDSPAGFGGSVGLTIGVYHNTAEAYINANATVDAGGKLTVRAETLNQIDPSSLWGVNLISPLIKKADYSTDDGTVTVQPGQIVEVGGGHTAGGSAGNWYEYRGPVAKSIDLSKEDLTKDGIWKDLGGATNVHATNWLSSFTTYLNSSAGVTQNLADTWSQATATGEDLALAGAMTVMDLRHTALAKIRSGAQINQTRADFRSAKRQDVVVSANSVNEMINLAGNIQLPTLSGNVQKLNLSAVKPGFGSASESGSAAGATAIVVVMNNDTEARIEDDVSLYGDSLAVTANALEVNVSMGASGGKSGNVGFNGSFIVSSINDTTIAQIGNRAAVTIGSNPVGPDGSSLLVSAQDKAYVVTISGGVAISSHIGVGASVGVNILQRDTQAVIGRMADDTSSDAGNALASGNGIQVTASNDGFEGTLVVAGAVSMPNSDAAPKGDSGMTDASGKSTANPVQVGRGFADVFDALEENMKADGSTGSKSYGEAGISISGAVAVNTVSDDTRAYVRQMGAVTLGDANLSITSTNHTSVGSLAGAVTISIGGKSTTTTAAVAGGVGVIVIGGTTDAFLDQAASVTGHSVNVRAEHTGVVASLAAGTSFSTGGKTSVAVAGSVAVTLANYTTAAHLMNTSANLSGTLDVTAEDGTYLVIVGGAGGFGGKAGVGVAVAYSQIDNTVSATAESITNLHHGCNVNVTADSTGIIVALAGSAGVGGGEGGGGGAGTVAVNVVNNTIEAEMINVTTTADGLGDVVLSADDGSFLFALAGAVALGQTGGFGLAIGVNVTHNSVVASMADTIMLTSGAVMVKAAESGGQIGIAAGGAGASDGAGVAGAIGANIIVNTTDARVTGSRIIAGQSVIVDANDQTILAGIAGAGAGGSEAAIGASIGANFIQNAIRTSVDDSAITSSNSSIALAATASEVLVGISLGGAGAGTFALGGSVCINQIKNTTTALVTDSNGAATGYVTSLQAQGDISVASGDHTTMVVLAGGGSGAGTAAIGASVSTARIQNTMKAGIENATVHSTSGGLYVTAQFGPPDSIQAALPGGSGMSISLPDSEKTQLVNIAIGGSGAGDFALGGSVVLNWIYNTIDAHISGSTVNVAGDVDVEAHDKSTLASVAGAGAGSGGAAIGAAVAYNNIGGDSNHPGDAAGNTITASISDSQLTGKGVTVRTSEDADIYNAAVGGAGAQYFALGGAVSTNWLRTAVTARVLRSTISANGLFALEATDESSAISVAGNMTLAFNGDLISAAVGASVVTNNVNNTVAATMDQSSVTAEGTASVKASSDSGIQSDAVGGSFATGFAAGGSLATNQVDSSATSSVTNSTLIASKQIDIVGHQGSTIGSFAGTVALAPWAGVGASIAVNLVDTTAGAAVENATVQSTGAWLSITTDTSSEIKTVSATGTGGGVGLAGAESTNDVGATSDAHVTSNSHIQASGSVAIGAADTSHIHALAGAVSGGALASVGASLATNKITGNISALVSGSQVSSSTANVEVTATSDAVTDNITAGGAGAANYAIGGAISINQIGNTIKARVNDVSTVNAATNVTISAADTSEASSLAGSVAGSLIASLGAASATNTISNTVEGSVIYASVTAGGGVTVIADQATTIEAMAAGLAGSLQVGVSGSVSTNKTSNSVSATVAQATVNAAGDIAVTTASDSTIQSLSGAIAVSVFGAGVGASVAYNEIADTIKAYVTGATLSSTGGSICATANGSGTIENAAVAGGGGGLAGVAGSIAIQTIANTVNAIVDHSNLWADDNILVAAKWTGDLASNGGTLAGGLAAGVGGTIVLNTLANHTQAILSNSQAVAQSNGTPLTLNKWTKAGETSWKDERLASSSQNFRGVAVIADSNETIECAFTTASLSIWFGLAVNKLVNMVSDATVATISDSQVGSLGSGGAVVRAHQETAVTNYGGVLSGAGVGIVGGIDTSAILNTTSATIKNSNVVAGTGGVDVSAWTQETVSSMTGCAAVTWIGGIAGAVSAVQISSANTASINGANITSGGTVNVAAMDIVSVDTQAGSLATGALLGVGGAVDFVDVENTTRATLVGTTVDAYDDTGVNATNQTHIVGKSGTLGVGGAMSVAGATSVHRIENVTEAYAQAGSRNTSVHGHRASPNAGQDFSFVALEKAAIDSQAGSGSLSMLVGYGQSLGIDVIRNTVRAYLGADTRVNAGGDVTVRATSVDDVTTSVHSFGASLLIGGASGVGGIALGGAIDDAVHTAASSAESNLNGLLKLSGGIDGLGGDSTGTRVSNALKALKLSVTDAFSGTHASASTTAYVDDGAYVYAGRDVTVTADSISSATLTIGLTSAGLAVGVGGSNGYVNATLGTSAVIGENANVTALRNLIVTATAQSPAKQMFDLHVKTGAGGIEANASALSRLYLDVDTRVEIGKSASLDARGVTNIASLTDLGDAHVLSDGSAGGLAAQNPVDAIVEGSIRTTTSVDSSISSLGNLNVTSELDIARVYAECDGGVGGLVGSGGQNARIELSSMAVNTIIGDDSTLTSQADVTVGSYASTDLEAYTDQDVGGAGTDASVTSQVLAAEDLTTEVGAATIRGLKVNLEAVSSLARMIATAGGYDVGAFGFKLDVTARVHFTINTDLSLRDSATINARDSLSLLTRTQDNDTEAQTDGHVGGLAGSANITADNVTIVGPTIDVGPSVAINTGALNVTADAIAGTVTYLANPAFTITSLGSIHKYTPGSQQILPSVTLNGTIIYTPLLELLVAADGTMTTRNVVAHVDETNHQIVVDEMVYSSYVSPQATLVVTGGGSVSGHAFFGVNDTSWGWIVNASSYALNLAGVAAASVPPVVWNVQVVDTGTGPDTRGFVVTDNGAQRAGGTLVVNSVADVTVGFVSMPDSGILISSQGDILMADGGGYLSCGGLGLTAGGSIDLVIHMDSKHQATVLSAQAGGDLALEVYSSATDHLASRTLAMQNLSAGGAMDLYLTGASYGGVSNIIPTTIRFTGALNAGSDATIAIDAGTSGLTHITGEVEVGGNLSLTTAQGIYVAKQVRAGGAATIAAGGDIVVGPTLIITARDVALNAGGSVGGSGDYGVHVQLNGGKLNATAGTNVEVASAGGPLKIGRVVAGGLARLLATDTSASNDNIVMDDLTTIQAGGMVWLSAGDNILYGRDNIHCSQVRLDLDQPVNGVNMHQGQGVSFTWSDNLLLNADATVWINTGNDDNTINVPALAVETTLIVSAGSGGDSLVLGQFGQVARVKGSIRFNGGSGSDSIIADNSQATADTVRLGMTTAADFGQMASLRFDSMTGGVWYEGVEQLTALMGDGTDKAYVDATDSAVQGVNLRMAGGDDTVRLGDGDQCLSAIHGLVSIDGGSGDNAVYITENNFMPGTTYLGDILTATTFTGEGMGAGVSFANVQLVDLTFGAMLKHLAIQGLPGDVAVYNPGVSNATIDIDIASNAVLPHWLTVDGAGSSGVDVNVDDSASTSGRVIAIDAGNIFGFGPSSVIQYAGVDTLNLTLGAGNDSVTAKGLSASTYVSGGAGDNSLAFAMMDAVDRTLTLSDAVVAGQRWGKITASGVNGSLLYDRVQTLSVISGTGSDTVSLQATDDDLAVLTLDNLGGTDACIVGQGSRPLSGIYGEVQIVGGSGSTLAIYSDDALTLGNTNVLSATLTASRFTGAGLPGAIEFENISHLYVNLGNGNHSLVVVSLAIPTDIQLSTGRQRVTLGDGSLGGNSLLPTITSDAFASTTLAIDSSRDAGMNWAVTDSQIEATLGGVSQFSMNYANPFELDLLLGNTANTVNVNGCSATILTIQGGAGDDAFNVKSLPVTTAAALYGAGGKDALIVGDGRLTSSVQGPVAFFGGAGQNSITMNASAASTGLYVALEQAAAVPSLWPAAMASIAGMGTLNPIFYDNVATISLTLTEQADHIEVSATCPTMQNVMVNAGGGDDLLGIVGTPSAGTSRVYGQIRFIGGIGSDSVTFDNTAFGPADVTEQESYLTSTTFTNRRMPGSVYYEQVESLEIAAGDGSQVLNVSSLPVLNSASVHLSADSSTVVLGYSDSGSPTISPILTPITFSGLPGSHRLKIDDSGSTIGRAVTFSGPSLTGMSASTMNLLLFQSVEVYMGSGTNAATIDQPDENVAVYGTAGAMSVNLLSLDATHTVDIQNDGTQSIAIGDIASARDVAGQVQIRGSAGAISLNVYKLSFAGLVNIAGGSGDDTLNVGYDVPGWSGSSMAFVFGNLRFDGGGGYNRVIVNETAASLSNREFTFNSIAGFGTYFEVTGIGAMGQNAPNRIFYEAEQFILNAGSTANASAVSNLVNIYATSQRMQDLLITTHGKADRFYVGDNTSLSSLRNIHGQVTLRPMWVIDSTDTANLHLAGSDNDPGSDNIHLTSSTFSGMGLSGSVAFGNMNSIYVKPNAQANIISVDSPTIADTAHGGRIYLENIGSGDLIICSTGLNIPSELRVNGGIPIYPEIRTAGVVPVAGQPNTLTEGRTAYVDMWYWNQDGVDSITNVSALHLSSDVTPATAPVDGTWAGPWYPYGANHVVTQFQWRDILGQGGTTQDFLMRVDNSAGYAVAVPLQETIVNLTPSVDLGSDRTVDNDQTPITIVPTCNSPGLSYGDQLTYNWIVKDAGSNTLFTTDQSTLTFNAPQAGNYTVTLTVTDLGGASASDSCTITVLHDSPVTITHDATTQWARATVDGGLRDLATFTCPGINKGQYCQALIDWGDGTAATAGEIVIASPDTWTVRGQHTYAAEGTYPISVTITHGASSAVGHATARVVSAAATVVATVVQTPNETPQPYLLATASGAVDDLLVNGPFTIAIYWGDGKAETLPADSAGNFQLTHRYGLPGLYQVTFGITRNDGTSGQNARSAVTLAAPMAEKLSLTTTGAAPAEGNATQFQASFTDLDSAATHRVVIDWGDGSSTPFDLAAGVTSFFPQHTYQRHGSYNTQVTVSSDGGTASINSPITVADVAPTIAVSGAPAVDEGSAYSLSLGQITDPGGDTVTQWIVHWGDGSSDVCSSGAAKSHVYAVSRALPYLISVDLVDEAGIHAAAGSAQVTVLNVLPTITAALGGSFTILQRYAAGGSFTDPGSGETYSGTVDYGDGSGVQSMILNPDRTFTLSHTYAELGSFVVTVSINDGDVASSTRSATVRITKASSSVTLPAAPANITWTGNTNVTSWVIPTVTGLNGASAPSGVLTCKYYAGTTPTGSPLAKSPIAVGTYTVVASYDGDGNYLPSTSAPRTFTISAPAERLAVGFGGTIGSWLWSAPGNWEWLHNLTPVWMVSGDLDGNGKSDMVVNFGGTTGIWIYKDTGTWQWLHRLPSTTAAMGDLNGDGRDELILSTIAAGATGIWAYYPATAAWRYLSGWYATEFAVGDFDGNGKKDVAADFGSNGLWFYNNDATWQWKHSYNPTWMAAGDLDGNGKSDLTLNFGGQNHIWTLRDTGSWQWLLTLASSRGIAADMNNDGQAELAINMTAAGAAGLWEYTPSGKSWRYLSNWNAESLSAADVDGDGKKDIVGDFGTNGLWVWKNDGAWQWVHSLDAAVTLGTARSQTLLADTSMAPVVTGQLITAGDLAPILAEAKRRLALDGIDMALENVSIELADLADGVLGETSGNQILIDRDAAGYGWFVDQTPTDDLEYHTGDRAAAQHMDLLTAVMHEMGHTAGLSDLDDSVDSLMGGRLKVGARRK